MTDIKKYLAELVGTFTLVFIGCGVAAALGCNGAVPDGAYVATALAFGGVIVAMAYSIDNVSGCHVNPAVSLALFMDKRLSAKDLCGYIVAQVLGAFAGGLLLLPLLGVESGLGANGLYEGNIALSLLVEVVLTFIFVTAVLGATDRASNAGTAGLAIGGSLTLVHLMGIHFTGTSVNPARSLAPALLVGGASLSCVWVFIVAPLVGGALAAVVYRALADKEEQA